MLLTDIDKLLAFKKEVIQRITKWPFFYADNDLTQQYVGLIFTELLREYT